MSARPYLKENSYPPVLYMACNTDMLSENITKLFLVETFTNIKALLSAATSAVKYCNHLFAHNFLFRKD